MVEEASWPCVFALELLSFLKQAFEIRLFRQQFQEFYESKQFSVLVITIERVNFVEDFIVHHACH